MHMCFLLSEDKDTSNLRGVVELVCPPTSTVFGHKFQDFRLFHLLPFSLPDEPSCSNLEKDLVNLLTSAFIKLERTGHIIFIFEEVKSYKKALKSCPKTEEKERAKERKKER